MDKKDTSGKKFFYLEASWPLEDGWETIERAVDEALGRSGSSGAGFGRRDKQWWNLTEEQAYERGRKLEALKLPGLTWSVDTDLWSR